MELTLIAFSYRFIFNSKLLKLPTDSNVLNHSLHWSGYGYYKFNYGLKFRLRNFYLGSCCGAIRSTVNWPRC